MPMFDSSELPDYSFYDRKEQQELTNSLLRQHVAYIADASPFYQERFAAAGINPADIRSVQDLSKLPFTTKADLEAAGHRFLCVPDTQVVDLCLTSGTTGKPVTLLQTRSDLERLGYNEEISFRLAGFTNRDRVVIACAMGRCFMAGLAYFLGLTRLGATAIRAGSGSVTMLMESIRRQRPTAIVGVPSLLVSVAKRLKAEGVTAADLGVKRLMCIGEPIRHDDCSLSALGENVREAWQAEVFGTYASTEMATAFTDCDAGAGGHIHPDLIVVEIVDEDGHAVPDGQAGEVVATPLQVTGMPLLRLRTGDIAVRHSSRCECGRQTPRLGPLLGRKSQMLKYRGTTVYPPAIFAVLQKIEAVRNYYIEVHDDYELADRVRVVIGVEHPDMISAKQVAEKLAAGIRVKPDVEVCSVQAVQEKTIQEGKRKPVRFFDYRKQTDHDQ